MKSRTPATPRADAACLPADEAVLVEALRRGDDRAFERLVREHGGRLLAVARRFLRHDEDAQDALQEAFLSAFKAIGRFEGKSRLSTWLHRITVNTALMRLRSQTRAPGVNIDDLLPKFLEDGHAVDPPVEWVEPAGRELEEKETAAVVRKAIDRLPETYRTVLLLRDIEELDTAEVAGMLGVTANVVKVRLHRARQALRTLLDHHFRRGAL